MINKKGALIITCILLTGAFFYAASDALSLWFFEDTDELIGAMEVEAGDWVADVGSGEGTYTLPMAEAVGDSGRAFAVDIDGEALKTLHEKLQEQDIENVTTILSTYDDPMLPRGSFDAVLVRDAYHEFTAPERMLRRFRSALKPEGRLVLVENIDDELVEAGRAEQVEDHDLGMGFARQELREAGFEVVREVDTLRYLSSYNSRYWMIVSSPASDGPGA